MKFRRDASSSEEDTEKDGEEETKDSGN